MQPSVTNQPVQGQGGGLAQMFRNNRPTAPGTAPPAQLPQIMAPQRPNIGLPPQAAPMPQMQQRPQGAAPAFGDMTQQQRFAQMIGGKFNPSTGRMDLPSDIDRGSAIAARNISKATMMGGGENPFGRNQYNFRGGSR